MIRADNVAENEQEQLKQHPARNRFEACAIGQELLDCGLLLPVCTGFLDEEDHEHADFNDVMDSNPQSNAISQSLLFEEKSKFSDMPGYIYRFPLKSGTAGSWSLFGAPIAVKVPYMTFSDDNDSKSTRDTIGFSIGDSMILDPNAANLMNIGNEDVATSGASSNNNAVHVKYLIDITHGDDSWQATRRLARYTIV